MGCRVLKVLHLQTKSSDINMAAPSTETAIETLTHEPNPRPVAKPKTTFLDLPNELRQQIIHYTIDSDYINNQIYTTCLDDLTQGFPRRSIQIWIFKPRTMQNWTRRLSRLHPIIAQDMEWVQQQWLKDADEHCKMIERGPRHWGSALWRMGWW